MGTLELSYALPVSCIRIDGIVTVTTDAVTKVTTRVPDVTVALHVGATGRDQLLEFKTGWIFNTSVALELTDDGRLVSSDLESSGQLGRVVLGVAGAGAAVAGVMLNPVALAGAATTAALRGAATAADVREIEAEPPVDPAIEQYRKTHKDLDNLRMQHGAALEKAALRIGELGRLIVDEPDPSKRWPLIAELRQLESVKPVLEAELDRLVDHFKVWRASQITTRSEAYERCFTLDTLRVAAVEVTADEVRIDAKADESVRIARDDLRVAVTIDPVETAKRLPTAGKNEILVRIPRRVTITVWEKGQDDKWVLREQKPRLVMDAACDVERVKLRKSAWAKRSVNLKFSDLGAMTTYKYAADSGAAAAADTLGALPATVAGGLEQAAKIHTQVAALRSRDLDRQLDRTKKEVELKQKEIEMAGLKVTEKDAAELERLKQQAEMVEKAKTIAGDPEPSAAAKTLAALQAETELLDARRAASAAKRKLAAETDLAVLRLEIERLDAQAKAEKLRHPRGDEDESK